MNLVTRAHKLTKGAALKQR